MQLPNDVRDAAIVAALLHDIGKLVIAYKMPDRFARLVARANRNNSLCIESKKNCGESLTRKWGPICWDSGDFPFGSPKRSLITIHLRPFRIAF